MSVSSHGTGRRASGFTIIEVLIIATIVGVLVAIAVPAYSDYRERVRVGHAISELVVLNALIKNYQLDANAYPASLAAIGAGNRHDPWGRPYVYLRLQDPGTKGQARKKKSLVPINSDFDLYSLGKDGASSPPLTAKASRDDVIRANDGRYYGLGKDYE